LKQLKKKTTKNQEGLQGKTVLFLSLTTQVPEQRVTTQFLLTVFALELEGMMCTGLYSSHAKKIQQI